MKHTDSDSRPFRVCVTGAECTGKTTLAQALGERTGAPVVYEAVRDYFAEKARQGDPSVFASDIVRVVGLQVHTEDAAPADAPLVILDTDVFTIAVWHERYIGHRFPEIDELAAERQGSDRRIDLYLLASPDIPFEHDSVRGSQEERSRMHEVFRDELIRTGRRFIEVGGTIEERCSRALEEIATLSEGRAVRPRHVR